MTKINSTGLAWHLIRYIQYLWCEIERIGHNKKTNEEQDKGCVEDRFLSARTNLYSGSE